jgi:tRNA dimethylallyltransferase
MKDSSGNCAVLICGPTAGGKSALALDLAQEFGGVIVNADSMQVYSELRVIANRPTPEEEAQAPHRLYGVRSARAPYSAALWLADVKDALNEAWRESRLPIIVGGTGLYFKALTEGLSEIPDIPADIRAHYRQAAQSQPAEALYAELLRRDPQTAARLRPSDPQRIVRALEVIALTGRPYSSSLPEHVYQVPALQIGLDCDRSVLDERVAARVAWMWQAGLVDEVDRLEAAGGFGHTAARAVGYAQVLALRAGRLGERQAYDQTVVATRRLARRQMGWFGRDPRVHWLDAQDPDLVAHALDLVERARAGTLPATESRPTSRRLGT